MHYFLVNTPSCFLNLNGLVCVGIRGVLHPGGSHKQDISVGVGRVLHPGGSHKWDISVGVGTESMALKNCKFTLKQMV